MTSKHLVLLIFFVCFIAVPAAAQDVPKPPIPDTQVRAERPDIDAAILAAALTMRGGIVAEPSVTITPTARAALRSDTFTYAGFRRPRYTLMRLAASEKVPGQVEIGAILAFVDVMLRRTSTSILLTVAWADQGKRLSLIHI